MLLSSYIIVYHLQYHDISCFSSTHDISIYHLLFCWVSYHVDIMPRFWWYMDMISTHDIWWYIMIYRQIRTSNSTPPTLHDIAWYHMISCPPNTAQAPGTQTVISCYIMSYHVISLIVIYNDITWYHMILVFKNIDMSPRYRMIEIDIYQGSKDDMEMIWRCLVWHMAAWWQPTLWQAGFHNLLWKAEDIILLLRLLRRPAAHLLVGGTA